MKGKNRKVPWLQSYIVSHVFAYPTKVAKKVQSMQNNREIKINL